MSGESESDMSHIQRIKEKGEIQLEVSEQRFSELYLECAAGVRNYVKKRVMDPELTEDIVQEVFCVAWRKKEVFEKSKNPMGWLINAAKYMLREQRRHIQDRDWISLEDRAELLAKKDCAYEMVEWEYILREFLDCREFQIFRDYFVFGHSTKRIACEKGITEGNLRIRLYRMKKRLTRTLQEIE